LLSVNGKERIKKRWEKRAQYASYIHWGGRPLEEEKEGEGKEKERLAAKTSLYSRRLGRGREKKKGNESSHCPGPERGGGRGKGKKKEQRHADLLPPILRSRGKKGKIQGVRAKVGEGEKGADYQGSVE